MLLLLVIASMLLISCDQGSDVTTPQMTEADWMEQGPYTLMLWTAPAGRHVQEILVVTKEVCNYIKINNVQLGISDFHKDGEFFYNTVDYYGEDTSVLVQPGATCNYIINVGNNKNYTGVFDTPVAPNPTFPAFNPLLDYIPQWITDVDPWNYLVEYTFADTLDNLVTDAKQVSGASESYTIPKLTWSYLTSVNTFDFDLFAVNYKRSGNDGLAVGLYKMSYAWPTPSQASQPWEESSRLLNRIMKGGLIPR
jgi:hypothetical protein